MEVKQAVSSNKWPQQRPLTLLCPTPPPLQPCPLMLLSAAANLQGAFSLAAPDSEPIDYSLKGRRDRSRSPSPAAAAAARKKFHPSPPPPPPPDAEAHERAELAASVIRARLDGHGRRVHLFLGVILHSALPLAADSADQSALAGIAVFCDQQRKPVPAPSQHFLVLNTQLLALTWCKFKKNSSSEFSTLTRAIRSSRQKYRGIFESVGTPCKKLYKFGEAAMVEFRRVFPLCYSDT